MFLAKQATSALGDKAYAEKEAAGGGGGLGPRWPKGLWDNSDGKHGLPMLTNKKKWHGWAQIENLTSSISCLQSD